MRSFYYYYFLGTLFPEGLSNYFGSISTIVNVPGSIIYMLSGQQFWAYIIYQIFLILAFYLIMKAVKEFTLSIRIKKTY